MKLSRLKVGLVTLAALASFIGCSLTPNIIPRKEKWKISAYLDGDSETESATFWTFNQLEKVGSNETMDIYAQIDRFEDKDGKGRPLINKQLGIDSTFGTRRYYVLKDDNMREANSKEIEEFGRNELNMGAYRNFEDFTKWIKNFGSDRHMLIIKGHGYGIMVPLEDILSTKECDKEDSPLPTYHIDKALKETLKKKIDLIIFDSCEKATIEVAYQLKNHAKVMVASEDLSRYLTDPGEEGINMVLSGPEYDKILEHIIKNPKINAKELGKFVVKSYLKLFKEEQLKNTPATLSATDMESLDSFVEHFSDFSHLLIRKLEDESTRATTLKALEQALKSTQDYLTTDSLGMYKHVDLFDFLKKIQKYSNDKELKKAIKPLKKSDIIIESGYHHEHNKKSNGLSILFIEDMDQIEGYPDSENMKRQIMEYYSRSDFAQKTGWDRVMELYQEYSKK